MRRPRDRTGKKQGHRQGQGQYSAHVQSQMVRREIRAKNPAHPLHRHDVLREQVLVDPHSRGRCPSGDKSGEHQRLIILY